MPNPSDSDSRIVTLEEIARTTVGGLSRIEASQARLETSQTEMRVAIMERIDGLEDKFTQVLDQLAIHSIATETVRRSRDEQREEADAQRTALALQRKAISAAEDQIMLLQRQIVRLDTQMRELRGG